MKYEINDDYVKIRNIQGKYFAMHKITGKTLYDPYENVMSKSLSNYTEKRIKREVWEAIKRHNRINKD